ncbi:hypothetical protein [Paraflavitalea sp. CAU 1676]|uniref:hypothetical protein n=1 Tax=Paraflavitalea sp. CAU 1676 TaxID=3032598 RepID=UPI0023DC2767|nr:hypothetical protein [Paraflavitalea sp. CAU 1676]MDF2190504.1 hypothetical protein [Paraflavitalea sp. CAU 1676]
MFSYLNKFESLRGELLEVVSFLLAFSGKEISGAIGIRWSWGKMLLILGMEKMLLQKVYEKYRINNAAMVPNASFLCL